MTKMAAMPIYVVKTIKNLLPLNCWTDLKETLNEALMTQILQCVYKS